MVEYQYQIPIEIFDNNLKGGESGKRASPPFFVFLSARLVKNVYICLTADVEFTIFVQI